MVKKEGSLVKKMSKNQVNDALIDNFVKLQKVLANLSIKFDTLSDNISKLLQLFEISAKSFVEKYEDKSDNKDVLDTLKKLDILLDQNKTIATGLTLIEEKMKHKIENEKPFMTKTSPNKEAESHGFYSGNLEERPRPKMTRI